MSNMDILIVIIAALLSGIVSIIISNRYYHRNEDRRLKLQVLQQLYGTRYDCSSERYSEALNQIPLVFHNSKEVLEAYKSLFLEVEKGCTSDTQDKLFADLIITSFRYLKLKQETLDEALILEYSIIKT